MRRHPWVCSQCQQIIEWHANQMEITEMARTVSHDYVLYTEVLRKVCKGCAVERMNDLKRIQGTQGALL